MSQLRKVDMDAGNWGWQSGWANERIRALLVGGERSMGLLVYATLTEIANLRRSDEFQVRRREIADMAGCHVDTVGVYLARLVEAQVIGKVPVVKGGHFTCMEIRLLPCSIDAQVGRGVPVLDRQGTGPGQARTGPGPEQVLKEERQEEVQEKVCAPHRQAAETTASNSTRAVEKPSAPARELPGWARKPEKPALLSFDEALAGGSRADRKPKVSKQAAVAKPFVGSVAVAVAGYFAEKVLVDRKFGGHQLAKPIEKELVLLKQVIADFGEETARRMIDCLVLDWNAAVEKWRLSSSAPNIVVLHMKRNDLAVAVKTGEGVWTITHRVSAWANGSCQTKAASLYD